MGVKALLEAMVFSVKVPFPCRKQEVEHWASQTVQSLNEALCLVAGAGPCWGQQW